MPKVSPIQESFLAGELSPLAQGRVSVPRFREGLNVCKNYLPLLQGPKTRRPGSQFIWPVKDSSVFTRIIDFQFSTTQAYTLEFGNQYIRFFKNGAIITNPAKNITAITQASPGVVTSTSHGYSDGDHVVITGIVGMTELNNREFVVANSLTNSFTLVDNITGVAVNTTSLSAYTSGGTAAKPYEVSSPYVTADLATIQYAQSDDVLFFAQSAHEPQVIVRSSDTSWAVYTLSAWAGQYASGNVGAIVDGPYYDENEAAITVAIAYRNSGSLVDRWSYTLSGVGNVNGGQGFLSTDVGRWFRFINPTDNKWYTTKFQIYSSSTVMQGSTSPTRVDGLATIAGASAPGTPASNWRLGFWSDTDGWPSTVLFHQNRLVFGGAGGDPTRFDGSYVGGYTVFSPTDIGGNITAANAYSFSLASQNGNKIRWGLSDEQGMMFGTASGEWVVTGAALGEPVSATSVSAKPATYHGSEPIQAVRGGKCTLFVQRGGRKLRELNWFFDVNGFRAEDLTLLSEHITGNASAPGIAYLATQKIPQPITWAVRKDGVLLAMTYERDLDALKVGWSRHVLGGSFSTGAPVVESIAVLPTSDGTSEELQMVVKRTVNGHTVRYIERMTQLFDNYSAIADAWFLDAGAQYSGSATTTVSGLNHLEGETVNVIADGSSAGTKTVSHGKITLATAASKITIGYAYQSDGQKLRTDAGSADGTAMGKTRRTHRIAFLLYNTLDFKLGQDFNSLDTIALDSADDGNFDQALGLYSGILSEPVSMDYDYDNMVCWRQDDVYPGTILGVYPQMVTQDRG